MNLPRLGTVFGGMRLDAVAGAGGMGTVYRAHDLALDRTVALKIVAPRLASDAEFRERFRREARLAAALDHPHVVPVLHAGDAEGFLYLTMRYIDGADLAHVLRDRGPLPPADAVEVVGQVASALDAAHARGLVHRDVKPANILMGRSNERWHSYLTDFGITKEIGDPGLTQTGFALGTVDYMAPEQAQGGKIDGRGDQYSLACVLFQALTGRVPFPAQTQLARVYAHVHQQPPDLRERSPDLPSALAEVVRRGMAKEPAARYGSCAELARAARASLGQAPGLGASGRRPAVGGSGPTRTDYSSAPTRTAGRSGPTPTSGATVSSGSRPAWALQQATPVTPIPSASGASPAVPRRGPSRRVVLGAAGGTLLLAGAAGGVVLATRDRDPGPATPPGPVAQIAGDPIAVGQGPRDLIGDDRELWTANTEDASVSRIIIATRAVSTYPVAGVPTSMAFGQGKTWVWNYSSTVTPVDRQSGAVGAMVRVEETIGYIAAGPDYLWFTVPAKGSIGRINMRTSQFEPPLISVGSNPTGLHVSNGDVRVVVLGERSLVTVNEASRQITARVALPAGVRYVNQVPAGRWYVIGAAGVAPVTGAAVTDQQMVKIDGAGVLLVDSGAWLLDSDLGEIRKVGLDLRSASGTPITGVSSTAADMELCGGSLWLTDVAKNTVQQYRPLA